MKKIFFLLLCGSLFFMSCKDDDNGTVELRYDGDNFSSPALPAGTFDAGQRFPSNLVDNYVGRKLTEVEYYIQDKPADCVLLIYGQGDANTPGPVLYSKNVDSEISANSWNTHLITDDIEIANEDIWIVIRLVHTSETRSIGCDEGPATTNGDLMLGEGESEWKTYRELSGNAVDVNWNIRGIIAE